MTEPEEKMSYASMRLAKVKRSPGSVASSYGSFSGREMVESAIVLESSPMMAVPHNTSNVSS